MGVETTVKEEMNFKFPKQQISSKNEGFFFHPMLIYITHRGSEMFSSRSHLFFFYRLIPKSQSITSEKTRNSLLEVCVHRDAALEGFFALSFICTFAWI